MPIKSRAYSPTTLKKLFSLAHNQCSFPECTQKISREDRDDFEVNICHIEDAKQGGRFRENMTEDERRSYDNLILLCPIHHIETNDETKYSVEDLKQMKINHHIKMSGIYSSERKLDQRQSYLISVINKISSSNLFSDSGKNQPTESFEPDKKIEFNKIKRYKPIIREYSAYFGKLNKLYVEIEEQGSYKKELLLQNIRSLYLTAQREVLKEDFSIENIQANADNLIEAVEKSLWDLIEKKSDELNENVVYEAINPSLSVILVDAFMRCKILEEPPKNDNQ